MTLSQGGGTRSSKKHFGSCSSRVDEVASTGDTNADIIDIDEEDLYSNSDDAITDSDEDDDAGIFSIVNDYTSEDDDTLAEEDTSKDEVTLTDEATSEDAVTLAEEEKNLLAVRVKRTDINKTESAEEFLLAREAVVRFVQDSIANAVDQQKRNADKNGRANVLSFNVNDLVLLSTVNLPKHVVTNVGSNKLLPRFIGPFRVLHRKGNAYTIELPRTMRTHPTFYVGRLRPYSQHEASFRSPHVQEPSPGSCNQLRRDTREVIGSAHA